MSVPRRERRAAREGFSLLEVLIAGVILAAAMVVLLGSVSQSLSSGTEAGRHDEARQLAADQLNRAAAGDVPAPAAGVREVGGDTYTWRLDRGSAAPGETIRCEVIWHHRGDERRISLERLAPPPGAGP